MRSQLIYFLLGRRPVFNRPMTFFFRDKSVEHWDRLPSGGPRQPICFPRIWLVLAGAVGLWVLKILFASLVFRSINIGLELSLKGLLNFAHFSNLVIWEQ